MATIAQPGAVLYLGAMLSVKISTKHQIVVPSAVRRELHLEPGDRLTVEVREGGIILRPRPAKASERLRGLGRGLYGGDPAGYLRRLHDEWEERQRERDALVGR